MVGLVNFIVTLLTVAIFARMILSFIVPLAGGRPHPLFVSVISLINQVTEPLLAPIRRVLPTFGMFDFSPMVALIVLWLIRQLVASRF